MENSKIPEKYMELDVLLWLFYFFTLICAGCSTCRFFPSTKWVPGTEIRVFSHLTGPLHFLKRNYQLFQQGIKCCQHLWGKWSQPIILYPAKLSTSWSCWYASSCKFPSSESFRNLLKNASPRKEEETHENSHMDLVQKEEGSPEMTTVGEVNKPSR